MGKIGKDGDPKKRNMGKAGGPKKGKVGNLRKK